MYYPVVVIAFGIMACLVTTFFATNVMKLGDDEKSFGRVEHVLKW